MRVPQQEQEREMVATVATNGPDVYLTDEQKLFRIVSLRATSEEMLVEIEDCRSLDVWLVPAADLQPLRAVRPGAVTY